MKTIIQLILPLFILSSLFTDCRRDPEEGPQGPQGPPGPGTLSSEYHQVGFDDWELEDSTIFFTALEVPELTQEVLENGAVMVYMQEGDDFYTQLPVTFFLGDTLTVSMEVNLSIETVFITWNNSRVTDVGPGEFTFRVVVISNSEGSGSSGSRSTISSENTNMIRSQEYPEVFNKIISRRQR